MWHNEFQELLRTEFQRLVAKNPAFSLRAFAKKLDMSPGAISDLLRGKRKVSPAKLSEILRRLNLDEQTAAHLIEQARMGRTVGRILIPEEASNLISNWIYFAILSVYECSQPPKSIADLSARLGISEGDAANAVDTLVRMDFLRTSANGDYKPSGISWRTEDGVIPNQAIIASHQSGLKLASKALEKIHPTKRDFVSITVSANSESLDKARKEVRKFKDRIVKILSVEQTDAVFRLNVNLFPVDQWHMHSENYRQEQIQ